MQAGIRYSIYQARSQDLEKGGAILKEWEVCKRPWLEFSLILNQFQTVCPKLEAKCLGKLGNSKLFSAQSWVILKKKGLRQNSEWFFGRNPKFKGFFFPKLGDLQKKKKKGLHQNWGCYFVQFRKFRRLRGAVFEWGGLFSIFHIKSASKAQKACNFAYFTSQWGGARAPRPPWLRYWYLHVWFSTNGKN